ncbi:hypothetical protein KQI86_04575 [Clostridium sp. MSJ-11]|uniref:Lipoprotein n=1 Tax=Clostridium mobile TaxID=2841512 RepID=A0ABS6EEG9_9CLOT|nr:hypothetical protein [Clostridium mobile]MBU5483593.1 hypothetical protein [Clostridium mobile]
MNKKLKKITLVISTIAIIFAFTGCGSSKNTSSSKENEVKAEINENKKEKEYSKELAAFFPKEDMSEMQYSGTSEYSEAVKIGKVSGTKETLIIDLKGTVKRVAEEGEGATGDKLQFVKEYTIDNESVKEVQTNGEIKKNQGAIEKSTILKLPLEKGNKWEDEVELKGKTYKAETTIQDISKGEDGKRIITTETIVKGVEGYPDKTYREIKAFKEGKGLVEFSNVLVFEDGSTMDFSYSLFEAGNE